MNRLLGTALKTGEVAGLLARVDVAPSRPARTAAALPAAALARPISRSPEDLIEEVARIYGYDRIEHAARRARSSASTSRRRAGCGSGARRACGQGLIELMTFPSLAQGDPDALRLAPDDPRRRARRIVNPIQAEEAALRPPLVPSCCAPRS